MNVKYSLLTYLNETFGIISHITIEADKHGCDVIECIQFQKF